MRKLNSADRWSDPICLLGLVMALGIPAIAWIENSALVLVVIAAAVLAIVAVFGGIGASGAGGASTRPLQDSSPRPIT